MNARRLSLPLLAAVPALAFSVACGSGSAADFREVLPDDRVLIALPEDDGSQSRVGEWSEYYLLTAEVTDNVNGLAGYVLVLLTSVTALPSTPAEDDPNTQVWGPFSDALDPVETELRVTQADDGAYSWSFRQRPRNDAAAEWTTVVTGNVEAGATAEASRGQFVVDWTAMSQLDPNTDAVGTFSVEYDIAATGVTGTAAFDDVVFDAASGPADALYRYTQVEGGDGAMDLAITTDMEDTETAAEETLVVRSRWQTTGAGRSDAVVFGGDLGEATGAASECWDTSFQSVWYADDFTPIEEGDAAACVFTAAEYADPEDVGAEG